jgi:hypothetical protein
MANHCMGMLQVQLQRHTEALPYLAAALNAKPDAADFWLGYLEALLLAGRLEEVEETLALAVHHGLGARRLRNSRSASPRSASPRSARPSPHAKLRGPKKANQAAPLGVAKPASPIHKKRRSKFSYSRTAASKRSNSPEP